MESFGFSIDIPTGETVPQPARNRAETKMPQGEDPEAFQSNSDWNQVIERTTVTSLPWTSTLSARV